MVFSSYTFVLVFLPLVLIGFALISRMPRRSAVFVWLVLASLLYCGWWHFADLLPLLLSLGFNFLLGKRLGELANRRLAKRLLIVGLTFNLALLGYFKYAGFLVGTWNAVVGSTWLEPQIILPIAISFYTFQQIAYLVDAYQQKTREHHFIDYCLFVTFFPQLIAGPIVHHADVLPQFFKRTLKFKAKDISVGISLFVFGLSKKLLIADEFSIMAQKVFDDPALQGNLTFATAWVGVLAYALQIYFDFSGYSDMALGLGRLFGIRLPLNFNSPYRATNIIEFWRRWHITLSIFLRDYLYIPLGGNRKGKTRRYINLMITMLLGGLWHGASWTFMLWGGLHGIYLMINHAWRALPVSRRMDKNYKMGRVSGRALTFLVVILAWVPFRAVDAGVTFEFYKVMSGFDGLSLSLDAFKSSRLFFLCVMLAVVWVMPNSAVMMRYYRPALGNKLQWDGYKILEKWKWRPELFWFIILALLSATCLVQMARVSEFIYYRF